MTIPRPKTIMCRYQLQKRRRIAVDCSPCGRCSYCVKAASRGTLPPPPGLDAEPEHGLVVLPTLLRPDAPAAAPAEPALPEPLDDGEPEDDGHVDPDEGVTAGREPVEKPARSEPKARWSAYVAYAYNVPPDAANAMTKTALVEFVRANPVE